jgi:hypothetical protein
VRSIASGVLTDKAIELLVAIAKGEAPPREEVDEESDDESATIGAEADSDDEPGSTGEPEAVQAGAEDTPAEESESSPTETEEPMVAEVEPASDAD